MYKNKIHKTILKKIPKVPCHKKIPKVPCHKLHIINISIIYNVHRRPAGVVSVKASTLFAKINQTQQHGRRGYFFHRCVFGQLLLIQLDFCVRTTTPDKWN